MSIQEGLEGSRGRDRVQWVPRFNVISRRSTSEIVLSINNLFSKCCKQDGKLDYSRYCDLGEN